MLIQHFAENASRRSGSDAALAFEGRNLSFAELDDRVRRLSCALRDLIPRQSRVAVLSDNRPELTEAQIAVPAAGMIAVFLNQRLMSAEIAYILRDSAATAVIVEAKYLPLIAEVRAQVPGLRFVIGMDDFSDAAVDISYADLVSSGRLTATVDRTADSDIAWLVYASGTTGQPKGAMLSHRNLVASVSSFLLAVKPGRDERFLLPFPLSHVAAYLQLAFLAAGTTAMLQRSFDVDDVLTAIAEHKITGTFLAPAMLGMIAAHPGVDKAPLQSVRTLIYGASGISPVLLRRSMELFANAAFVQGFGMTETGGSVVWMDPATHCSGVNGDPHVLSACGRPTALASVRIVDGQDNDVPIGVPGEILIRADQVMEGYWGNTKATENALAGGWLHTGDVGRLSETGLLYVVDRTKDMILTGGENVYSREVENALAEHPDIADVAVIGVPDDLWGESVCAVVVRVQGSSISAEQIVDYSRQRLASYKKPKIVHFVDSLPRNVTGKVLKHQLRSCYAADRRG